MAALREHVEFYPGWIELLLPLSPEPDATPSSTTDCYPNSLAPNVGSNALDETLTRGADPLAFFDTTYTIDSLNAGRRALNQNFVATVYTRDTNGNVTTIATNWYAASANLDGHPPATPLSTLRSMSYTYGAGGVIASMTDYDGNTTTYTYDTLTGYLTQISAPAGTGEATPRVTSISRNNDGSISQVIDPRGQKTTYVYDGLGRLKQINYGVGGSGAFSVTYTLDADGNLTAMSDHAGSSSWVYDENDHVTSESRTQNGATKTAGYAYFADGLLHTITTFGGQTVNFGYDNDLRLVTETDPNDGGRTISFGYDGKSRRTSITFPSGVSQQFTLDPAGRIDQVTLQQAGGTLLQSFNYDLAIDATGTRSTDYHDGEVTSVTELDGSLVTYGYDDFNRLLNATRTGTDPFTQSYVFDDNDNRASITDGGTTITQGYDAANQMTSYNGARYTYDRDGNLVSYGTNSLTYDASNRWASGTVNGSSVVYQYDGFGRRVSAKVGTQRTDMWYDHTGLTLETGANAATYLRDPEGLLLSLYTGSTAYDYGHDRTTDITALISTAGALVGTYRYDPWGQALGTVPAQYNPFGYAQTYQDSATGMSQMGARYYAPTAGRFSQLDPAGRKLFTGNRYAYASCDPSNRIDPSGLGDTGVTCGDEVLSLGESADDWWNDQSDQNTQELILDAAALFDCLQENQYSYGEMYAIITYSQGTWLGEVLLNEWNSLESIVNQIDAFWQAVEWENIYGGYGPWDIPPPVCEDGWC